MAHLRPLDLKGALVALLLAALWGGNPVAVKIGLAGAPPLRLAWMRFVLGGLTILAYVWHTRRQGVLTVKRGEWGVLWSLGLLFTVQIGLMNIGINLTTAAHASIQAHGAVTATNPARHPLSIMPTSHFFVFIKTSNIATAAPAAAARLVLTAMTAILS